MHERRLTLWTALAGLLIGLATPAASAAGLVGKPAPNVSGKDAITGKPIALEDLRGKVVLVDFWATWCPPCRAEVPNVRRVYSKYKDRGFEILSVSLDTDASRLKSFVKKNKMSWHHVLEGRKSASARKYGVRGIPSMFLIDHEGKCISDRARGSALASLVDAAVKKLPKDDTQDRRGKERTAADQPRKQGDGDRVGRLGDDVAGARERLRAVAAPLDRLDASLGSARADIAALDEELMEPDASERTCRRYDRMRDELARVRCRLFVCGALGNPVTLPAAVFAPDERVRRSDFLRAAGQLGVARAAVETMETELQRVRREIAILDERLDDLGRRIKRDGGSQTLAAQSTKAISASAALVERCNDWPRQIDAASEMIAGLSRTGYGSRFERIEHWIAVSRKRLEQLSFGDAEPEQVRAGLALVCDELGQVSNEFAVRGVLDGETVELPTNSLEGASSRDVRARVQAAVELDVAEKALTRFRELSAGFTDTETTQLRDELAALRGAVGEASDPVELDGLEQEFTALAGRLLELHDRFGTGDT